MKEIYAIIISLVSLVASGAIGVIAKVLWDTLKEIKTEHGNLAKKVEGNLMALARLDHIPQLLADIRSFQKEHLDLHERLEDSIDNDRINSVKVREKWIPRIERLEDDYKENKRRLDEILTEIRKLSHLNNIVKG